MMRTYLSAVSVAALVALTGCSGSDSDDSPISVASANADPSSDPRTPATGPTITGTGYTYKVPKGWGKPPHDVPGFDFDSVAASLRDTDGFGDNLNVIRAPGGTLSPQEVETGAEQELSGIGATDVTVNEWATVAGDDAAHLTAGMALNGLTYTVDQFYLSNAESTYVATFSFSTGLSARERAEVTDAVLASWDWTS